MNDRKRQDESKDDCSEKNVEAEVLLEGERHLVECVKHHFLKSF